MVASCCVKNCTNRFTKDRKISFFRFPKQPEERRNAWVKCLKRLSLTPNRSSSSRSTSSGGRGQLWTPSKYDRICGDHFITGRPHSDPMHPDYVPNRNLGFKNKVKQREEQRLKDNDETTHVKTVGIFLLVPQENVPTNMEKEKTLMQFPQPTGLKERTIVSPEAPAPVPVQDVTPKRLNPYSITGTVPLPLPATSFQNKEARSHPPGFDALVSLLLAPPQVHTSGLKNIQPASSSCIRPSSIISQPSAPTQADTEAQSKVEPEETDTHVKTESEDTDTHIKEESSDTDFQSKEVSNEPVLPVMAFVNTASAPDSEERLPAPYVMTLPDHPSGLAKVDASTQTCNSTHTDLLTQLRLLKREVEEKDVQLKLYRSICGLIV